VFANTEGLNITMRFVDAFTIGIAQGPHLKDVLNSALEEVGESLNVRNFSHHVAIRI
jgi:hypothetical protein